MGPYNLDQPTLPCYNHPKIGTRWLYLKVMLTKDADGIANSVDLIRVGSESTLFAQTCLSENLFAPPNQVSAQLFSKALICSFPGRVL